MSQEEGADLKWREFALVYVAYMGFLCSRKNYGFWLRPVISDLGYAKGEAGLIGSTLEVTYGTCSFLNGVVVGPPPAHTPRTASMSAPSSSLSRAARTSSPPKPTLISVGARLRATALCRCAD